MVRLATGDEAHAQRVLRHHQRSIFRQPSVTQCSLKSGRKEKRPGLEASTAAVLASSTKLIKLHSCLTRLARLNQPNRINSHSQLKLSEFYISGPEYNLLYS